MKIAVIGGTGNLGYGLALRLARAGHAVTIGSRAAEKALRSAAEAAALLGDAVVGGADNAAAASGADLVILAVPFEAQQSTLESIRDAAVGKVVIDTTVPLAPGEPTKVAMPAEGSAAERTQKLLPDSMIVAGFHHVGAKALVNLEKPVETDVLICGDSREAKEQVLGLMEALGTRGIDCGGLRQAQVLERMTALLISLNIRHRRRHTGIRITGL